MRLRPAGLVLGLLPAFRPPPSLCQDHLIGINRDVVDENRVGVLGRSGTVAVRARGQGVDFALDERRRRRTGRQGPEIEMLQDPADGRGGVDEGDDLEPAAAIGADQRVDLVGSLFILHRSQLM
jgi:hypothetical protein